MKPLERVMRLMTHLNIAATLATAAWVLWSGTQIVAGTSPWPGGQAIRPTATAQPPARSVAVPQTGPSTAQGEGAPCHGAASPTPTDLPATARGAGWFDT